MEKNFNSLLNEKKPDFRFQSQSEILNCKNREENKNRAIHL